MQNCISVNEAARRCGICRSKMFLLLRDGEGPESLKIGSRRLIPVHELDAWIARQVNETKLREAR